MTTRSTKAKGAARLAAVQALYQMDIGGVGLDDVVAEFEAYRLGKETDGVLYRDADSAFFHRLVSGVVADQRDLDPKIHSALEGWPLTRIDVTLRAILRAATRELLANAEVPARVVISEYVDIAKAFFDGDEPGMVNGVLDNLARKLRPAEFEPPRKAQGEA
jgi:transcription antitermination protein NusB